MALIIDLIIVAIILLFTFLGYKRGLVKLAISLCTFFIAIIVAFALFKPISNVVIENTSIDETIENTITDNILPEGTSPEDKVEKDLDLPNMILKGSENTVKDIANSFSTAIIETACFLIIFIVVKIVLKFVTVLADLIAKLPILKQFNELGGTIYGVLEGLLIVFVIFAIISLVSPLMDASILNNINESVLGSWFYNNNILVDFIM